MKFSNWLKCSAALACVVASPVMAQDAAGPDTQAAVVGDIVVTAQRREQRLQDVPLAVSAFGAEALAAGKVESLINLDGKIPNVQLAPVGAYPFASAFFIRGLGFADVESSFEPSVGVELDGVYLSRNVGAVQDFFDIGGVTILRGPQGTLYGRNTIGGVVSIQSRAPSHEFGARAQATIGSNGRQELRAAIEGPLVEDKLAGKISILSKSYDGFMKNDDGRKLGEQDVFSIRGSALWTPTDSFDASLIVDYTRDKGTGPAFENASLPGMVLGQMGYPADQDGQPFRSRVGEDIFSRLESTGATLQAHWDVGPVKLTSITGYRKTDTASLSDFDGEMIRFLNVGRDETHDQLSQEFRLNSSGDGPLNYVVGAYFLTQEYDIAIDQYGLAFGGPDAGSSLYANQKADARALFGQVDYEAMPGLILTAGARYSEESKTFTIQPLFFPNAETSKAKFDDFSPKFGISYAWTPDVMTYAQYARGFRAGGFNGRAGSFAAVGPYGSEAVDTYEAGVKSELFNHRLRLNVAAFSSTYKDMQQSVIELVPGTNINQNLVTNVGEATINGFEAEALLRVSHAFSLSASLAHLDAGFDDFTADLGDGQGVIDRTDLPFAYAPKWSSSLTADYSEDYSFGRVTAQASLRYASDLYTSFAPRNSVSDLALRKANTILDASLGLESPDGRWRANLWGKNLTDELVVNNTFSVGDLMALRVYQPPREIGLDIGYRF